MIKKKNGKTRRTIKKEFNKGLKVGIEEMKKDMIKLADEAYEKGLRDGANNPEWIKCKQ